MGGITLDYIVGRRLSLRPLVESDFNDEYLYWLNDPEVNKYSQRRPFPQDRESMRSYSEYYSKNSRRGFVLAIILRETKEHIGNIALVNVEPIHRCAEISILIGNKDYWGKGMASEAIYLLTQHGFVAMNLHKIFAGTFNPAFARCVEKLSWRQEGVFRDRIWSGGKYHNQRWFSVLRDEFEQQPRYEPFESQ
jgi:ribosomal-protein-alanine N-acetyltransferase